MSASKDEQAPSTIDDIKAPTATAGIEVPVVFGTKLCDGANVVWYGDFKSVPLR